LGIRGADTYIRVLSSCSACFVNTINLEYVRIHAIRQGILGGMRDPYFCGCATGIYVKRSTGHTHTHTPTENNTPDTHIHDKNDTLNPQTNTTGTREYLFNTQVHNDMGRTHSLG